ncbi:vancomycin resistance protein YoaR [Paenibacillus forsythiae]|uniref:Vancomycin resistance protein YoaR n=1 Tax=Paenibacillus forsythiae TaxID=365616 RepID=A0ABU3HB66_9BACL|nr:VanW family protein [Paenibacillus forsythiae]MDT3427970.1 vancomycin resistance protein YoaR [Paenibacillus forsythiae]
MRKTHGALIALIGLILAASLVYGGLYLYAGQRSVPERTTLAGWNVGGMDIAKARAELERKLQALHAIPVTLTGGGETEIQVTLKDAGISYDADPFLEGLDRLTNGGLLDRVKARRSFVKTWGLEANWDSAPLKRTLSPQWERTAFGEPVNATRRITESDQIVYTPGETSRRIDWNAMESSLRAALPESLSQLEALRSKGVVVQLPLKTVQPDVTVKSLQDQGVARKIAEFSTSLGSSGPGRSYNVNSAAKAVNDTLLPPGGIFDYGKAIEKAEQTTGFREAPVIVSGRLQPGVGGGICQVSSTLYNAALRTGLEIVERRSHSLPVSYLPKGQDATFSQGSINFRFRNNTGHYLLIRSAVAGRALTVKFFGTFPQNVSYEVESRTVDILSPGSRTVSDASLPPGASRTLQSGKAGYIVETYVTRKVDGKAVDRKKLSRDIYRPQQALVAVGSGQARPAVPEPSERPLVEDGIRKNN